jgi:hypothetical protein
LVVLRSVWVVYLDRDKKVVGVFVRFVRRFGHDPIRYLTSYSKVVNHNSFSLYNQAPQLAGFNRGKWSRLEKVYMI